MLTLIRLLGEKEEELFVNKDKKPSTPQIRTLSPLSFESPQKYFVLVEGEEVCQTNELLDALCFDVCGILHFQYTIKTVAIHTDIFNLCIFNI